ncbi:LOW QUALITY PROTEIN: reverse transcriptase [Phytophthora megakarya]|uniref:Reverse transcriptase n=1 Tax=Phytophthora megakarya TaxID=4795 RepID=A0A225WND4_9STRA|nr:LOW QUALITY PROTEIN: reverse transcriptase [Phytophthora megakarya]
MHRFIEDYAIYASVVYEVHEVETGETIGSEEDHVQNDPIAQVYVPPELQLVEPLNKRWNRAQKAFTALKTKIVTDPIVRHFNETRTPVVIVYGSDWAKCASLRKNTTGSVIRRTLKTNELNYNVTEKEVLALLRILDLYYNLLVGGETRVLTRNSTLAWLFKSKGLQGRIWQWSALLAPWTLEIAKCTTGEDEILGAIADSITPRKEAKRRPQTPIPTVDPEEELWVISFDGSARVKRGGDTFSAISARMGGGQSQIGLSRELHREQTEYNGLILGLDTLEDLARKRLVIGGDSNLLIRVFGARSIAKHPGSHY